MQISGKGENMKKRVLFLCTGNSCRSQMAQGIINHDFGDKVEAYSAGTSPKGLDSKAIQVMAEFGIDISQNTSDHVSKYKDYFFDYVITLCDDAEKNCPIFLRGAKRIHMGFEDPPEATGSEKEIMNVYRKVRDEIRKTIGEYFNNEIQG